MTREARPGAEEVPRQRTGALQCRPRGTVAVLLLGVLVWGGCADLAPPLSISGTGDLEGFLYFDADEDGVFDPSDGDLELQGVNVVVQDRGTDMTFAGGSATTDADGRFAISDLPLGTHDLVIDTLSVPSEVSVCQNPVPVTIYIDETRYTEVRGRPGCLITIGTAKELGAGEFVIVRGIVTSFPGQIEASFTYIEEPTGGLFVFGSALMGQGIEVGDQIEVGGTTAIFSGQFELTGTVTLRSLVKDVGALQPRLVTTAEISASGSDPLDDLQNRFVRIEAAEMVAAFGAGGANIQNGTIDDGSGATTIRIDDGVADRNTLNTLMPVGKCYDVNGFAANFNGGGQIFPRSVADIVEVPCT